MNINKKIIIPIVIFTVIVIVIGIFFLLRNNWAGEKAVKLYQGTITIGENPWPGYVALYVARDKGYFRDAGLNVEIKPYSSLSEISKDYVAGKMQGRTNLTLDAVSEAYEGLDHRVVLAIDYSAGADAIMARQDIKTVADFKGKRVAYEFGTLEEFFLTYALGEYNFALQDIISVNANPEQAAKLLEAGTVDIAVTFEPYVGQLISKQGFHAAYSSKNAPGPIMDILTFRSDFIQQYPDTIQALVSAYFRAIDFLNTHPDEAHAILAKEFNDTPENVAKQLEGLKILNKRDNKIVFSYAAGIESLYGNIRITNEFLRRTQKITLPSIDETKIVSPDFIRQINQ